MAKTAMQSLIKMLQDYFGEVKFSDVNFDRYTDLEREQIEAAYTDGWNDRGNDDGGFSQHKDGEDYFAKTYKL